AVSPFLRATGTFSRLPWSSRLLARAWGSGAVFLQQGSGATLPTCRRAHFFPSFPPFVLLSAARDTRSGSRPQRASRRFAPAQSSYRRERTLRLRVGVRPSGRSQSPGRFRREGALVGADGGRPASPPD